MAIAGKVVGVEYFTNEEMDEGKYGAVLKLHGEDRGQDHLTVENPDPDLYNLIGETIWGGDAYVMVGKNDTKIANRKGYTRLVMTENC